MTATGTISDIGRPAARPGSQPVLASDAIFPARVLCGLLGWAAQRSISLDSLMPGLREFDPRQRLSYEEIRLGFARAAHRHGRGDFACITGGRKQAHHLGPLGPAQLAQPTLGDAMAYGIRHQLVAGSMLRIELVVEGDTASIECHRLFDDDECGPLIDIDHLVAAYNVMTGFCGTPIPLDRVELASDDPQLSAPLGRILHAPVQGGRPLTRMVFPALRLATPNACFEDMTQRFWSHACESEAARLGNGSPLTLWRLLRTSDGDLRSLDDMAAGIGVSLRTMHRLLVREGIDYSVVADRHRKRQAEDMLLRGDGMDDIAHAVGLSDARSLRRSFRRWTGLSPSAFRSVRNTGEPEIHPEQ